MSDSDETQSGGELADADDVIEGQFEVNKQGDLVKRNDRQPNYTVGEMSVVWQYFENRYEELYGEGKGSNIAYCKSSIWMEFASAVDAVEQGARKRTVKRVWKKLDNMKFLGRSTRIIDCVHLFLQFQHDIDRENCRE